jgi:hypothetical protein
MLWSGDARVADVSHGDEYLEWVLVVDLSHASLHVSLDLGLSLLAMTIFSVILSSKQE